MKKYLFSLLLLFFGINHLVISQGNTPCTAASLSVGASCSYTAGTTVGATYQTNAANGGVPSCASPGAPDVWYSFVAPAGGAVTISTSSGTITDGGMSLYSATTCNTGLTQMICDDDSGPGLLPEITQTGLTSGNTYYIRFWKYSSGTGTFNICISTPAGAPSNDLCSGATNLPCGTSALAGTTVSTTNTAHGTSCSMSNYGVWYSFVGDGNNTTITVNNSYDIELSISSGSCGTFTNVVCTDSPENHTFTTVSGVTYYVYVAYWTTGSTTGTFDISRTCSVPPVAPANDNCAGATALTVNPDLTCTTTTSGTVLGATASADGNTCSGTDDDDVWFSFVATGTTHYVDLLNVAGSVTDMYHVVYSGTCGSLSQMYCSDGDASTANGLTIGATYYIRVYTYTSTGAQTSTFDVCVTSDPPPITACSGNFYDTGGAGGVYSDDEYYYQTYCSSDPSKCLVMTFSSFDTESCCDDLTIYNGPDQTSPIIGTYAGTSLPNGGTITASSGCLTIVWDSDGSVNGNGWAAAISCGTCPAPTCSDGVQNGTETGVDCGGTCGACPVIGPCGNLNNNDFCSDPAILTQGGGGWSSSTTDIYSYDDPGTSFCGSIENNSWYVFTASATSEVFNFTSITNCTWGDGIQAEVFDVTTDVNGCCTSLSSVSNCWNPATTSPGTVTATGLTIGQDYYLMVDGWGGDNCDFTVSNWTASGILPVKLVNFNGYRLEEGNKLIWTTESEVNNDYFIIQKSSNTKDFFDVGIVDGNGNSNTVNNYSFFDISPSPKVSYYRLKQIDFDGVYAYSKTVAVKMTDEGDVSIYPNPAKEALFLDINSKKEEQFTIRFVNVLGAVVQENIVVNKGTNTYQSKEFKQLQTGIYFVQLLNAKNETIKNLKIVKE